MRNVSDREKLLTVVGVSLFIIATAALSVCLYGEVLNKTKSVILMVCATVAAAMLFVGQYLHPSKAGHDKRGREGGKRALGS